MMQSNLWHALPNYYVVWSLQVCVNLTVWGNQSCDIIAVIFLLGKYDMVLHTIIRDCSHISKVIIHNSRYPAIADAVMPLSLYTIYQVIYLKFNWQLTPV